MRPNSPTRSVAFAAALLTSSSFGAIAQLSLEFGDPTTLLPSSSLQIEPNGVRTIGILVNNSGSAVRLSGYTFELGIGDGGTPLGGSPGPSFVGADLVTDTPFSTDHGTPVVNGGPNPFPGLGTVPQYLGLSLTTVSAAVTPETVGAISLNSGRSLLATLTVSASGFTEPLSYPLRFFGVGSATFLNDAYNNLISPGLQEASITVVPEPQHYALAAALGLLVFATLHDQFRARKSSR